MKTVLKLVVVFGLVIAPILYAQTPDLTIDQRVAALESQVNDLLKNLQSTSAQVQSLTMKLNAQPPSRDQAKTQKQAYVDGCQRQGLTFTGITITAKTGDVVVNCK